MLNIYDNQFVDTGNTIVTTLYSGLLNILPKLWKWLEEQ